MNIEKVYNNLYLQSVERWSLIIEKIYSKFTECGKMIIEHWESLQQICIVWSDDHWTLRKITTNYIYRVWKDHHWTLRKFAANLQSVERWSMNIEKVCDKFTLCGKMIIEHWESLQQIYRVWKDDHWTLGKFTTNLQCVEKWSLNIEKVYNKFTDCGKMIIEHWESLQQIYRVWKGYHWTLKKFTTNLQSVERWSLNIEKVYNKFTKCGRMIIEHWES